MTTILHSADYLAAVAYLGLVAGGAAVYAAWLLALATARRIAVRRALRTLRRRTEAGQHQHVGRIPRAPQRQPGAVPAPGDDRIGTDDELLCRAEAMWTHSTGGEQ